MNNVNRLSQPLIDAPLATKRPRAIQAAPAPVAPAQMITLTRPVLLQLLGGMMVTSTIIFALSGIVGFWVAYDRTIAIGRFGLLAIGLLLFVLLAWSTRQTMRRGGENPHDVVRNFAIIGVDSGIMAGGIGLLFLLTHNWQSAASEDFTLLPWLTSWIQTQQPLWGQGLLLHENLVAGALLVLLPLAFTTLWQIRQTPALWVQMPLRYWSLAGVLVGTVALLLTFSRSAWLGLFGGAVVAAYLNWRTDGATKERREQRREHLARQYKFAERHGRRPPSRLRRGIDFLLEDPAVSDWMLAAALLVAIGLLIAMTLSAQWHQLIIQPIAGTYLETTINSRLAAWQEALPLIQDYSFTGSGLGSTAMVLASYVYLLHVPYLYHAHSLYLQIAVEQGLPGLIGWVGIALSALGLGYLWLRQPMPLSRGYAAGALTAQIALLIYGATDAELYVGIFVPLLFLPAALLLACAPHCIGTDSTEAEPRGAPGEPRQGPLTGGSWLVRQHLGTLLPLLALLVLLLWPGAESRWLANLTAVGQTQQELALYEWPAWPLQDALRRSEQVDTARWIAHYQAILQIDSTNVTALRRLGQIALSQGDYREAEELLERAYRQAPRQRAIRQLLGEAKALLGHKVEAAQLWQAIDLNQGQADLRLWWYEHADGEAAAQPFAEFLQELPVGIVVDR